MTRKQFRQLVQLKERLFQLTDDLEKLGVSILESELFTIPGSAIDLITETNFTEKGIDLVNWWLYENSTKEVIEAREGKEIAYDVEDVDSFYDYLVENNYVISSN